MRAFLHKDFRTSGNTLLDTTLGLRYSLTPDAAWLVKQLKAVERLDHLVSVVAQRKLLAEAEAKQAVYSLLAQLGGFGAIVIEWGRSFNLGLRWRARWTWLTRQKSSPSGLAWAAWRAYGTLLLGFETVFVVFWVIYGLKIPISLWVAPPVLFTSLLLHEVGHVVMARLRRVPTALLSKFGYLALIYKRPGGRSAQQIAAAGPLVAISACVPVIILVNWPLARWGLVAIALAHFMCLLPFTADGKTIWRRAL